MKARKKGKKKSRNDEQAGGRSSRQAGHPPKQIRKSKDAEGFETKGVWKGYGDRLYNSATRYTFQHSPGPSVRNTKDKLSGPIPNVWLKAHLLEYGKSGRVYYYNPYLQQTSWIPPLDNPNLSALKIKLADPEKKLRQCPCCVVDKYYPCLDRASMKFYWYNNFTKERTWEKPGNDSEENVTQFIPLIKYLKKDSRGADNPDIVKNVIELKQRVSDYEDRVSKLKLKKRNLEKKCNSKQKVLKKLLRESGQSSKSMQHYATMKMIRSSMKRAFAEDQLFASPSLVQMPSFESQPTFNEVSLPELPARKGITSSVERTKLFTDNLRTLDIFGELNDADFKLVKEQLNIRDYKEGTCIIRKDAYINHFFVLLQGTVRVEDRDSAAAVTDPNQYSFMGEHYITGEVFGLELDEAKKFRISYRSEMDYYANDDIICLVVPHAILNKVTTLKFIPEYKDLKSYNFNKEEITEALSLQRYVDSVANVFSFTVPSDRTAIEANRGRIVAKALLRLCSAFIPLMNFDDLLSRMVHCLYQIFNCEFVSFFKIVDDKKDQSLVCFVGDKFTAKGEISPLQNSDGMNPRKRNGILDFAVNKNVIVSLNALDKIDTGHMKLKSFYFDVKSYSGSKYIVKNIMACPLTMNNEVVGVVRVMNKGGGSAFSQLDEQILDAVCLQMTSLIEKGLLFSPRYADLKPICQVDSRRRIGVKISKYTGTVFKNESSQTSLSDRVQVAKESHQLEARISLYHGSEKLTPASENESSESRVNLKIQTSDFIVIAKQEETEGLKIPHILSDIPRTAVLVIEIFVVDRNVQESSKRTPLGWTAAKLFDFEQLLRCDDQIKSLFLYPHSAALREQELCRDLWFNSRTVNGARVVGALEVSLVHPYSEREKRPHLIYTDNDDYDKFKEQKFSNIARDEKSRIARQERRPNKKFMTEELRKIKMMLPLLKLKKDESFILLQPTIVEQIKHDPTMLSRFIESVYLKDPSRDQVMRMYSYLSEWDKPDHLTAVQLIGPDFTDPKVRALAVQAFGSLSDTVLSSFLIQLVQALKYESFIDNPLACLLINRSIQNGRYIGVQVYWAVHTELASLPEKDPMQKRYMFYKNLISRNLSNRTEVSNQHRIIRLLQGINFELRESFGKKNAKFSGSDKTKLLRKSLEKSIQNNEWPPRFSLPLNLVKKNKSETSDENTEMIWLQGISVKDCSVMSSKKLPFKLLFFNEDPNGEDLEVLFKVGDDLRQDQLTLQVISVMDRLWKLKDLDLQLSIYKVIAVTQDVGFIEVVKNSKTLAKLQVGDIKKRGMLGPLKGAWEAIRSEKFLREWKSRNDASYSDLIRDNFITSCAGYCVLTYVLGIGDRHNDNLMMTDDLKLFHIDFGHFLGNFKRKFGVKRENAPFVLTAPMLRVIDDNKLMVTFEELCLRAFNILRERQNVNALLMLFYLMLSSRIPELEKEEDLNWLQVKLSPELDLNAANKQFRRLIAEAAKSATTQFNHFTHIVKHYKNYFDKPSI